MPKLDWYYHRPNCITCKRAQTFLQEQDIEIAEQVNAGKIRFEPDAALKLAREATRLIVAKGKKVTEVDLGTEPTDEELSALIIGPSGFLRAPAYRKGTTMLVGFSPEEFADKLLAAAKKK